MFWLGFAAGIGAWFLLGLAVMGFEVVRGQRDDATARAVSEVEAAPSISLSLHDDPDVAAAQFKAFLEREQIARGITPGGGE